MGCEWRGLLRTSLLYFLIVLSFPIFALVFSLIAGDSLDMVIPMLRGVTQAGILVAVFLLTFNLGRSFFGFEHRNKAWEYVATFPVRLSYFLWLKFWPRLFIIFSWCLIYWIWIFTVRNKTITESLVESSELIVMLILLLLFRAILGQPGVVLPVKKHFFDQLTSTGLLLFLWIFFSWVLFPLDRGLFFLKKEAFSLFFIGGHNLLTIIVAVGALIPMLSISYLSLKPLNLLSPERCSREFLRVVLPIFTLPWIWLVGAIVTGGIR